MIVKTPRTVPKGITMHSMHATMKQNILLLLCRRYRPAMIIAAESSHPKAPSCHEQAKSIQSGSGSEQAGIGPLSSIADFVGLSY